MVVYGTADEIKYRFGYVKPIHTSLGSHTDTVQICTQIHHRRLAESETGRRAPPPPFEANVNDMPSHRSANMQAVCAAPELKSEST